MPRAIPLPQAVSKWDQTTHLPPSGNPFQLFIKGRKRFWWFYTAPFHDDLCKHYFSYTTVPHHWVSLLLGLLPSAHFSSGWMVFTASPLGRARIGLLVIFGAAAALLWCGFPLYLGLGCPGVGFSFSMADSKRILVQAVYLQVIQGRTVREWGSETGKVEKATNIHQWEGSCCGQLGPNPLGTHQQTMKHTCELSCSGARRLGNLPLILVPHWLRVAPGGIKYFPGFSSPLHRMSGQL